MRLRRLLIACVLAALGAAGLAIAHGDEPLGERVVRIETAKAFPEAADELNRLPADVRLALLDYRDDEELLLSARLALERHPDMAPRVIGLYGAAEAFRGVLRQYGPAVVPPIHYFLEHDVASLRLRALVADAPSYPGPGARDAAGAAAGVDSPLVRGAYAIAFIDQAGHDFLGQFVVDGAGHVAWIQSERLATGAKRFFTSGITGLEAKWQRGDELAAADFGWAAVDVLIPIAAFRAVRVGRAATRSAATARAGAGVTRAGSRLARSGRTLAIAGTAAGIGYVALNPGVINSIGAGIAATLGVPTWAVNGVLWFILLLPLFLVAGFLRRWLARPICRLLGLLITGLAHLQRRIAGMESVRSMPREAGFRGAQPGPRR